MRIKTALCIGIVAATLTLGIGSGHALQVGDVIINEVFFNPKGTGKAQRQAVELLVVKDGVNLNGLTLSDRDIWDKPSEDQCTLQDLGRGFLNSVRSGTLIVIHGGTGDDDTSTNNFVLRFYAKSSLFCNTAPTGNAFRLGEKNDNLHLIYNGKQIDFLKYRTREFTARGAGHSGTLNWHGGPDAHIDAGSSSESTSFRFMGNKPDLNDFPATWQASSDSLKQSTIGKPNGGVNTEWIRLLREKSLLGNNIIVRSEESSSSTTQ